MYPCSSALGGEGRRLGRSGQGGGGTGPDRPLCGRRGKGALGPAAAPLSKTHGKIYNPACKRAGSLCPPVGPGSGCRDSRIVPSAPPRAGGRGQRRRPGRRSACLLRSAPRGSAGPRTRPLPPAPWEAKVTACAQSGSRPLPSWKSGSSVPYLSSV